MRPSNYSNKGFTLVELLATVVIVGVLATILLPRYKAHVARARMAEAKVGLGEISALQGIYLTENYRYHSGLHYGLDKCGDTASEAKNGLGFRLENCSDSRYRYITNAGNDCAKSDGSVAQGEIYPGCPAEDIWTINPEKDLVHAANVVNACPDATASSSSSTSCTPVTVTTPPPPTTTSPTVDCNDCTHYVDPSILPAKIPCPPPDPSRVRPEYEQTCSAPSAVVALVPPCTRTVAAQQCPSCASCADTDYVDPISMPAKILCSDGVTMVYPPYNKICNKTIPDDLRHCTKRVTPACPCSNTCNCTDKYGAWTAWSPTIAAGCTAGKTSLQQERSRTVTEECVEPADACSSLVCSDTPKTPEKENRTEPCPADRCCDKDGQKIPRSSLCVAEIDPITNSCPPQAPCDERETDKVCVDTGIKIDPNTFCEGTQQDQAVKCTWKIIRTNPDPVNHPDLVCNDEDKEDLTSRPVDGKKKCQDEPIPYSCSCAFVTSPWCYDTISPSGDIELPHDNFSDGKYKCECPKIVVTDDDKDGNISEDEKNTQRSAKCAANIGKITSSLNCPTHQDSFYHSEHSAHGIYTADNDKWHTHGLPYSEHSSPTHRHFGGAAHGGATYVDGNAMANPSGCGWRDGIKQCVCHFSFTQTPPPR